MSSRADGRAPIVLFGLFGVGNLGNDASLRSVADGLRALRPDVTLASIASSPEFVRETLGLDSHALRPRVGSSNRRVRAIGSLVAAPLLWWRELRWLRSARAVVIPGTGILDDFGERVIDMPLHIALWALVARLARRPLHLVSIGAGPIDRRVNRWLMLGAARSARTCSVRDDSSLGFLTGHGFRVGDVPVEPDVAFGLPLPPTRTAEPAAERPIVGVGVMRYFGWDRQRAGDATSVVHQAYLARVAQLVVGLDAAGCDVRLVHGEHGDGAAMDDVLARVAAVDETLSARIERVEAPDFDELLRAVGDLDLLVATRFHNVVAGLMTARPVVSLGYAAKNRDVMESFGLGRYCHEVERFDVDTVLAQVQELRRVGAALVPDIRERALEHAAQHQRQLLRLLAALDGDDRDRVSVRS